MFANHAVRLHAFGLLIVGRYSISLMAVRFPGTYYAIIGDVLYLWRYDRQGIIQCSGFNFILDLPRFLVLLLIMQRFENRHWGLNPHIDDDFGHRPGHCMMTLRSTNDPGEDDISITLELSDQKAVTHFGLNGRATNMFSAKSRSLSDKEDDLVVKIFWPEVVRMSEPDILRRVYSIAEHNDDVKGHVPEFLWHKVFFEDSRGSCSTHDRLSKAQADHRTRWGQILACMVGDSEVCVSFQFSVGRLELDDLVYSRIQATLPCGGTESITETSALQISCTMKMPRGRLLVSSMTSTSHRLKGVFLQPSILAPSHLWRWRSSKTGHFGVKYHVRMNTTRNHLFGF